MLLIFKFSKDREFQTDTSVGCIVSPSLSTKYLLKVVPI